MTNDDATPLPSAADARAIAKDAYVYGFPLVDNYRIMHAYFVDMGDPGYKGPWNTITNVARVYTYEDTTIQTANSDTPYSFLGADLRAEPLVLTVPKIDGDRYFSLQFVDLSTYNFAYVGSRATGNGGGRYLLAGPGWSGATPAGIDAVVRCETELALVLYRTQLFESDDLDAVKAIQAGYTVQPLSAFLGQAAPAAPAVDWYPPLDAEAERSSPAVFDELGFLLGFCPVNPSEAALRDRFATLGIAPGQHFDPDALPADVRQAVQDGIADAWAAEQQVVGQLAAGTVSSGDLFGTREQLGGNDLFRMTGAAEGIYGNSKEEAIYPAYLVDADGAPLDGSAHAYTLRLGPGQLPPSNAFWSVTMYSHPQSLLVENPIGRYLINSPMLPGLVTDADGGATLRVQHASPGPELEPNWLPAPDGTFSMVLRIYWPKPEALDGRWTPPPLQPAS